MTQPIILASGSRIRAELLTNAGLTFSVQRPQVDEGQVKKSLLNRDLSPQSIAEELAQSKAHEISESIPQALVIGCDQVLEFDGRMISKPQSRENALQQLMAMRGRSHWLLSAVVLCQSGRPLWRHTGRVRMEMRNSSDTYLRAYVARNWDSIRDAVGAYKLEEEGVRLFSDIDGDYFHVLGMPLLELLNDLTQRGVLES
jgi:nucleoside triphosphate pyrophosphatase